MATEPMAIEPMAIEPNASEPTASEPTASEPTASEPTASEPKAIEHRLARAEFTLTRDYPVPVERVWDAFADEDQKLLWYGAGDAIEPGEWAFDFRVGGRDIAEGKFHNGPVSRYEATYTDIVEHVRIVTTYDMWIDGVHMSTSLASLEFEPIEAGTRFTHTEHGVFFDQFWADGPGREQGTRGLVEALAHHLAGPDPALEQATAQATPRS